jgi:hypothetical protein
MQDKREMAGSGLAGFLIKNRTSVDSVAKLIAHRPEKGSVPGFKTRFPRSQEKTLKKAISSSCANVQAMLLQKKLNEIKPYKERCYLKNYDVYVQLQG